MSESLKQRIVGALVLVALAIIIIPLTFDFSGERQVDVNSAIPPMPDIEPVVVAEPQRPEGIVPAKSGDEIFQFGVESTEQSQPLHDEAPALSADGMPIGWVLQVGSFKEKAKADELVKKLLADGYQAFIRQKKGAFDQKGTGDQKVSSTLSRVFVGPKVLKKKLLQEKTAIDKKYGVDSLLLKFEP